MKPEFAIMGVIVAGAIAMAGLLLFSDYTWLAMLFYVLFSLWIIQMLIIRESHKK
jgi:hypothetical protein